MRLKAFLSSSFSPEDEPVIEKVREALTALGIECRQGKDVASIPDGIIDEIRKCELFVAVLTPKIANQVSSAVTFEVGAARALGKHPIIFRDETVEPQGIYADTQQKAFSRERLLAGDTAEASALRATVVRLCGLQDYRVGTPDPDLQGRYEFAKALAVSSGSSILGYFKETLYHNQVRDRAVKNYPTDADEHANRLIENAVHSDFLTRSDAIISEESIKDVETLKARITESEYVWIVDPLDGTLNFAYSFPYFCVSIGLLRRQEPVMGVVYDPTKMKLYCGLSGYASECVDLTTGAKTTLSLSSTQSELGNCIVMSHLSSHKQARVKTISVLDHVMEECRGMRFLGSGQLALVSLAQGQFDIFFNYRTNVWDIVPGYVILKGAGGYASSSLLEGEKWDWRSRGIIAASNAQIGEEFRKFLRGKFRGDFPAL